MPLDGEFYMRPAFVRFPLASFCSFLRSRYTKFSPCHSPPPSLHSPVPRSFPRLTHSLPPSLVLRRQKWCFPSLTYISRDLPPPLPLLLVASRQFKSGRPK